MTVLKYRPGIAPAFSFPSADTGAIRAIAAAVS
ncbi:hypothetical protein LMG26691_05405 [Achromobacter animicus]|nr:hypothetical protein LMG26691_05405 [Achromobacter animicus]